MGKFYEKIERISKILSGQYGELTFLGLVKVKISPKKWDVVVCADGLPKREKEAIRLIVGELQKNLTESELAVLSRVVVLDKSELFIQELQQLVSGQQEKMYKNITLSNLSIKELRILQLTDSSQKNRCSDYLATEAKIREYFEKIRRIQALAVRNSAEKNIDITYSQKNDGKILSNQSRNIINSQKYIDKMVAYG